MVQKPMPAKQRCREKVYVVNGGSSMYTQRKHAQGRSPACTIDNRRSVQSAPGARQETHRNDHEGAAWCTVADYRGQNQEGMCTPSLAD